MKFEIVGKLEKPKSDKIKFYEETTSENGWMTRTLKFNIKSGNNTFLMDIRDGRTMNEDNAIIFSMIKKDDKYENVQFLHRDKEQYIPQLAEFKKSVIKFSNDAKLEFATQYDFALAIKDLIENPDFKDAMFKVVGDVEYTIYQDKTYKKMIPKRIYVTNDTTPSATGLVDLLISENSFDDINFKENKTVLINGFVAQYDKKAKKELAYEQQIEYNFEKIHGKENANKAYNLLKSMFNISSDELYKLGFKVEFINGTEKVPFTLDMATDDEKTMVELGFITLEDLQKQYGFGKGSFISKVTATGLSQGYGNGKKETGKTLLDYQENAMSEDEIDNWIDDLPF
jgi:hypothetical protein